MTNEKIPILIIGNKLNNVEEISTERVYENFELDELKKSRFKVKYFSMNIETDDKLTMKSIRWLIKHML